MQNRNFAKAESVEVSVLLSEFWTNKVLCTINYTISSEIVKGFREILKNF